MAVKRKSGRKSRRSRNRSLNRNRSRSQKRSYSGGGEDEMFTMQKGMNPTESDMNTLPVPTAPSTAPPTAPPMTGGNAHLSPAEFSGGRKRRNKSKRKSSQCGGEGVLATAAVPFGLLALQRYFSGSRKSKNGFRNKSKRTFRRRK